ncbi:hypothetical protein GGI23_005840, partial [Coemansia sp. RSA 2559]
MDPLPTTVYGVQNNIVDTPTHISSDILIAIERMSLKEKVGQMMQIDVGQLVDSNGSLSKAAAMYWIREWNVGS